MGAADKVKRYMFAILRLLIFSDLFLLQWTRTRDTQNLSDAVHNYLPDSRVTALTSLDVGPDTALNRHWENLTCGVMDMLYSPPKCRSLRVNSLSVPDTKKILEKMEVVGFEVYCTKN